MIAIGRKGRDYFKRRRVEITDEYIGLTSSGQASFADAQSIAEKLIARLHFFNVGRLDLEIVERAGGWECDLRFRSDLYEKATAARLLAHYLTLLESIATNPDEVVGRLQLLTPDERRRISGSAWIRRMCRGVSRLPR